MHRIQIYNVAPSIPPELRFLETLSRNLWWSWNQDAVDLLRRMDSALWQETRSNPMEFLTRISQSRLEALATDRGFVNHMDQVRDRFETEMNAPVDPHCGGHGIAYFSLEFGLHESIRLYSGGLGVLAGDHLKSASDLKLPLVAVGLLYRVGYFRQQLDREGRQQESYPENDFKNMPVTKVLDPAGQPVTVSLALPEGRVRAVVWRLDVGRVPLYLLDTNIPENPFDQRRLTSQLYAADRQTRVRQELLLGIGGFQALVAMGCEPAVCHMNEGHAAVVNLARIAHLMKRLDVELPVAQEIVRRTGVFSTHTPVQAGNEAFEVGLLQPHLEALEDDLGLDPRAVIEWGQPPSRDGTHEMSMTVLGLRMSRFNNGVSRLHGDVERRMWEHLWPGRPKDEIPIKHVTNGVHVSSWLAPANAELYRRYLEPEWMRDPTNSKVLFRILQIPDEELWRAHEMGRSRLVRRARELVEKQLQQRNANRTEIAYAKSILDHDALTIGFARRFATYKRATLLLRDIERLDRMLADEDRPVQFIFSGKAHPADEYGKDLIRQIVHYAERDAARRRFIFLENYDMHIARFLVQGVDVWLNTPRRPHEASGTSGMKVAINGGMHLSVLDGWWCEGYTKGCGWAIGNGEEYDDPEYQDMVESQALYNLLEDEVIPCFYDRQAGGVPRAWIKMMKASITTALGRFCSHRMVAEYAERYYQAACRDYDELTADAAEAARTLVARRERVGACWPRVRVAFPQADGDVSLLHVGDAFCITTRAQLGELTPDEVDVEVYYGPIGSDDLITESNVARMSMVREEGEGTYLYTRELVCGVTGRYGFTARVVPSGAACDGAMPGFITWADGVPA